jgi:hypothetical protein
MSDPIAQAAANLSDAAPSSTEPVATIQTGDTLSGALTGTVTVVAGNVLVNDAPVVEPTLLERAMNTIHDLEAKVEHLIHPEAVSVGIESKSSLESAPIATAEVAAPVTGNVLVNETLAVSAPVVEAGTADMGKSQPSTLTLPASSDLPRESHLMLLEAKIAGFRAKLANAERVALDEFEAIVGHVKAVL